MKYLGCPPNFNFGFCCRGDCDACLNTFAEWPVRQDSTQNKPEKSEASANAVSDA